MSVELEAADFAVSICWLNPQMEKRTRTEESKSFARKIITPDAQDCFESERAEIIRALNVNGTVWVHISGESADFPARTGRENCPTIAPNAARRERHENNQATNPVVGFWSPSRFRESRQHFCIKIGNLFVGDSSKSVFRDTE